MPPLPTECNWDRDCDDGNGCNGRESCINHECVRGTPVECVNPDVENCTIQCESVGGDADCVVTGVDKDGDGYGASECTAGPGEDCDDDDEQVHPGAVEICDGLDSDCDGLEDRTEDQMVLSGAPVTLIEGSGAIRRVEHAEIEPYFASTSIRMFSWIDWSSGVPVAGWDRRPLTDPEVNFRPLQGLDPRDVRVSSLYVVSWIARDPATTQTELYFAQGSEIAVLTPGEEYPITQSLTTDGDRLRVVWIEGSDTSNRIMSTHFATRDPSSMEPAQEIAPPGQYKRVSAAGQQVVWSQQASESLDRIGYTDGNGLRTLTEENVSASHPIAASLDTFDAVAWRYEDGRMIFRDMDADCSLTFGDEIPGQLRRMGDGWVLVATDADRRLVLAHRIRSECERGPTGILEEVDDGEVTDPRIAVEVNADAVWTRIDGAESVVRTRPVDFGDCE